MRKAQEPDFAAVLARLSNDAGAYFGVSNPALTVEKHHERPFSTVARIRVHGAGHRDRYLYAKIVKPRSSVESARRYVAKDSVVNRRTYLAMRGFEDIGAVPPVACYPDLLALVTEEVSGPTLLTHLASQATWFATQERTSALQVVTAAVGRWIQVFQTLGDEIAEPVTVDGLVAYVDIRLTRLVRQAPERFSPQDRETILGCIGRLGASVRPDQLRAVPVHADMSLGNIIVSGRKVVVLDFAMAGSGGRLQDVSRLFLQLEMLRLKPHIRTSVVRSLQEALLAGFDRSLHSTDPLFRIHLMLHRVNNFAKLMLEPAQFPAVVYDRLVLRAQRRGIRDELLLTT